MVSIKQNHLHSHRQNTLNALVGVFFTCQKMTVTSAQIVSWNAVKDMIQISDCCRGNCPNPCGSERSKTRIFLVSLLARGSAFDTEASNYEFLASYEELSPTSTTTLMHTWRGRQAFDYTKTWCWNYDIKIQVHPDGIHTERAKLSHYPRCTADREKARSAGK